eukprot:scaffold2574_cov168-Amphora_coffeaeformis.AAC.6
MVAFNQQCCWIFATLGYASAFVSRCGNRHRSREPPHVQFATDVRPDLDQLAKEWMHQVKADEKSKIPSRAASHPNHAPAQPRGSNKQKDVVQLAEEWGAMNRDTDYRKSSKGVVQYSTPPPATSSMNALAEAWIVANKDTDKFTDTPPMSTSPVAMQATPVPVPPQPKGNFGPSMVDLANTWASMNKEADSFIQPPPTRAFHSGNKPHPQPAFASNAVPSSAGSSLDGLAQAWIVANKDTDKFTDTPPMSTTIAPTTMQAAPAPRPAQPKGFSGASMDELAKAWASINKEADASFHHPTPMFSPSAPSSHPGPASRSSSPTIEELGQAWASSNRDFDSFLATPPPSAIGSPTLEFSGNQEYVSPASYQTISPSGSMAPNVVDWETLAAEWSSINRDMDTGYRPTPEMKTSSVLEDMVSPSLLSATSLETRSVDWENLANEWKAMNTDIDRLVGTIQTVDPDTLDNTPNIHTPRDSVFNSLESSWNEMSQELDYINHEAVQTFEALQQMESEMNSMIDQLHAREASYEQKLRQLQEDSSRKETELMGQLQTLGSEYDAFKRHAEEGRLVEVRAAEEGQRRLSRQIAELKQSLAEKIGLAQQESERAQEYMAKYQESQSQLSAVQESHKQELAQIVERLKPSVERLENIRRVTGALRSISQGTREIMARMREKLLEYNACLSRIRSFLAGTRSRSTLTECQRLIEEAKKAAGAMQAMAEVEGNPLKVREAKNLLDRDIQPLAKEIEKQLNEMSRQELFYQAPDIESAGSGGNYSDLDSLIHSSDALLRESQSILAETEQIGTATLQQMGRQREQLENSNRSLDAVLAATLKAKNILVSMSWRAWKSKFGLYCMITLLSVANLYVLVRNFKKKHGSHDNNDNDD